jgi:hypothetical protein
MNATAKVTITAGPDRGKEFELGGELIHIGRGADNQIVLEDAALGEHQASIMFRNGRYAVYAAEGASVDVDGNALPEKRWVWLPDRATIRLGERSVLEYVRSETDETASDTSDEAETPPPEIQTPRPSKTRPPASPKRPPTKRSGKAARAKRPAAARQIARFVTDQAGDPLVRLGEDGHMPELTLAKGAGEQSKEASKKKTNPLGIYAAIAISVSMSMAMLFIDATPPGASTHDKASARRAIQRYYGQDSKNLQPHERLLRQAHLAYSRRDYIGERRAFKDVLALLNSEDLNPFTGLTGSTENDAQLKELMAVLMSK